MSAKVAHNVLLSIAFVGCWCAGVALLGQDPRGLDWPGLLGGLGGLLVFFVLHNIARRGEDVEAPRHSALSSTRS